MPLVNAQQFIDELLWWRFLWFQGRMGSGKTALAYRIAWELFQRGEVRLLVSNINDVWSERLQDIEPRGGQYLDAAFIVDEGGMLIKTAKEADELINFSRKVNTYVLLPSVQRPSHVVRSLNVLRMYNLYRFGCPAWVYRSEVVDGDQSHKIKQHSWFIWWRPSEIFGVYDTESMPYQSGGIPEYLQWHFARVQTQFEVLAAQNYQYAKRLLESAKHGNTAGEVEQRQLAGGLEELAHAITGGLPLPAEPRRGKRQKRRAKS